MGTFISVAVMMLVALALIFAEFFIPSFGVIAATALLSAIWAIVIAFKAGTGYGYTALVSFVVLAGLDIVLAVKLLPYSPLVLKKRLEATSKASGLSDFVGKQGVAETALRPSGRVRVDGNLHDAMAEGRIIDRGTRVEVVRAQFGELVVRPAKRASNAPHRS